MESRRIVFCGWRASRNVAADGGIALGHSGGTRLTYDLGRTWTRIIPCGGYAVPVMLDDDTIAIGNGQNWGGFNILRRIETRYFEWVKHRDQLQQDSDLVAYYDFENVVAQLDVKNIALNSTESLTGKIIAAQNFQGRWPDNRAAYFDGDRTKASLPDHPAWDFGTDDYTIEMWVNWKQLSASGNPSLIDFHTHNNAPHTQRLAVVLNNHGTGIDIYHGAANWRISDVDIQLAVDTWYHIVVVHNGDVLYLYKNGEEAARASGTAEDNIRFGGGVVQLGRWSNSTEGGFFHGSMDDLAIYQRRLTADEVRRHYQMGKPN